MPYQYSELAKLVAKLRLDPSDTSGPSRMDMLRERETAAEVIEALASSLETAEQTSHRALAAMARWRSGYAYDPDGPEEDICAELYNVVRPGARASTQKLHSKWLDAFAHQGKVQAWILIEAPAWEQLQLLGTITCPARFASPDEEDAAAYAWMRNEMAAAGVPPPAEGLTPWWVWVQRDPGHRAPYLEDLQGISNPVVLELQLPATELVQSCFDAWHAVLSPSPLYDSPAAEAAIEAKLQAGGPAAEEALRTSWQQVFDLGQIFGEDAGPETRSVQACTWILRLANVVRVVPVSELDSAQQD